MGGNVEFICPIDGQEFESYQDFSSTSFGARLDLQQVGLIAQPWALPDCPRCHFVLYEKRFSKSDLEVLKLFILSDEFKRFAETPSYNRLGVIKQHLNAPSYEVAWAYHQASWQVEDKKDEYSKYAQKAIAAFLKSQTELEKQTDKYDDYLIACYLPIEISRRLQRFDEAKKHLSAFPKIGETEVWWLPRVLKFQKKLIRKKKDSKDYLINDAMSKWP